MSRVRAKQHHHTRRSFLKLGAAAASIGVASALRPARAAAPAQVPAAKPKRGGNFTAAWGDSFSTFNPYAQRFQRIRRTLYDALACYDREMNLQPQLAEKWQFTDGGKTVTFKLREGVKYHSGREFTSADVKASLTFAANDVNTIQRPLYQIVKQVELPDKYTAIFRLDKPNATIYDLIDTLPMIDSETIEDSAKIGVGTGPFKLDKYIPNDRIEFVAFKDYWDRGKPYLDRFVARIIPDANAMSVNLESGAVDCITRVDFGDAVRFKGLGGKFVIDMGPSGYAIFDIGLNTKLEPFTNKKVRQAIAWSIDRDRFCKTVLQGLVAPTCLIWPPHSWAYQKEQEGKIGFDLEKARNLMKEAGVGGGFDTEILTSRQTMPGYGPLAVILQSDLQKVGIRAKITDIESTQYANRTMKGDIAILVHAYSKANIDPASTLTGAKAWYPEKESGWTHFESAEYEKLRQDLATTVDRQQRVPIARKIQELALDECFTISVAQSPSIWAVGSYVKGLWYDYNDSIYAEGIWLDK